VTTKTTTDQELIVTRRLLWRWTACERQRKLFTKTFGPHARVAITEANAVLAARAGLDLWWMSNKLLTTTDAQIAFERAIDAASAERLARDEAGQLAYERGHVTYKEWEQCWSTNRDTYLRDIAVAIVRAYREQEAGRERAQP